MIKLTHYKWKCLVCSKTEEPHWETKWNGDNEVHFTQDSGFTWIQFEKKSHLKQMADLKKAWLVWVEIEKPDNGWKDPLLF